MRILEALLASTALAAALLPTPAPDYIHTGFLAAFILFTRRRRWNNTFTLLVATLQAILLILFGDTNSFLWWIMWVLQLAGYGVSLIFLIRDLPEPTGPFGIGWVPLRAGGTVADVLYPIDPDVRGCWAPYFSKTDVQGLVRFTRSNPFVLGHLAANRKRIGAGVPPANPKASGLEHWPIVVFSHGLGGCGSGYSTITRDIASHGFIVVALTHTDGSAGSVKLDDGSLVWYRPVTKDDDPFQMRHSQLQHRADEVSRVLDELQRLHEDHLLHGMLDFARIGCVGHSFGGSTAMMSAYQDPRIRAVFCMDGWMMPISEAVIAEGIDQEIVIVMTEEFFHLQTLMEAELEMYRNCSAEGKRMFVIRRARHQDQSDYPLFVSSWIGRQASITGSIGIEKSLKINCALSVAFLKKNLHSEDSPADEMSRSLWNSPENPFREDLLVFRPEVVSTMI